MYIALLVHVAVDFGQTKGVNGESNQASIQVRKDFKNPSPFAIPQSTCNNTLMSSDTVPK